MCSTSFRTFLWMVGLTGLVFATNLSLNQRGAFDLIYNSGVFTTRVMWGYPAILTVAHPLVLQFILCLWSLWVIATTQDIRGWMVPYFIPYAAVCSMLGPESFSVPLIAVGVCWLRLGKLLAYGVMIGLAYSFRAESLALLVLAAVVDWRKAWKSVAGAVPFVLAWVMVTGHIGSTNAGHTAYISLGSLPDNPWHIQMDDRYAVEMAKSLGVELGTDEADAAFRLRFVEAVKAHPFDYLRKMWVNVWNFGTKGFYVGEYSDSPKRWALVGASAWRKLTEADWSLLIDYGLSGLFRIGLVVLLALTIYRRERVSLVMLGLIVLQVALLTQEQRHANVLIIPLLTGGLYGTHRRNA